MVRLLAVARCLGLLVHGVHYLSLEWYSCKFSSVGVDENMSLTLHVCQGCIVIVDYYKGDKTTSNGYAINPSHPPPDEQLLINIFVPAREPLRLHPSQVGQASPRSPSWDTNNQP